MSQFKNLIGQRFGRLIVQDLVGMLGNEKRKRRHWLCLCDCGTQRTIVGDSLTRKRTISCGCYALEVSRTLPNRNYEHGDSIGPSSLYATWEAMRQRCSNPNNKQYPRYGGRGIYISDDWNSFASFKRDMGERPEGMSIDRIDNDGPYCKENCRWASRTTQQQNTSISRVKPAAGKVSDIAASLGLTSTSLSSRMKRGWSQERALTTPKLSGGQYSKPVVQKPKDISAPSQRGEVPHHG